MSKYEVGARIGFPIAGHVYRITAVIEPECTCEYPYLAGSPADGQHHPNCAIGDESQRGVTFANALDPGDSTTETAADLDAADVTVLPAVRHVGSDAR